jgi:hypothetical protein
MKASIGIFEKKIDYDPASQPNVPDEVFEAALHVAETKKPEVVLSSSGFYVIQYSPNGPWKEHKVNGWLPVHVSRIDQWISGGIKECECCNYIQHRILGGIPKEEYELFLQKINCKENYDGEDKTQPTGNTEDSRR